MVGLGARLLLSRLRRNVASSLLVAVVLATAGAAGVSAVLLRDAVSGPWDRAFAATDGADVHVTSFGDVDPTALANQPGVVGASEPVVATVRQARLRGQTFAVALAAIPDDLTMDRPLVTEGVSAPGAMVLERSFGRALGARVGDQVEVRLESGWVTLPVSGVVVTVRAAGYPATVPGTAFVDQATASRLGSSGPRLTTVGLRLEDPSLAPAVAAAVAGRLGLMVKTASDIRAEALDRTRQFQVVLGSFAVVLLVAAGFLVAVLLGARLRAQSRELLLLRLVGLTPGQLVGLVAAEHAVLAVAGGMAGTVVALVGGRTLATAAATALGSTAPRPGVSVAVVNGVLVQVAAVIGASAARRVARSSLAAPEPVTSAARPSKAAAWSLAHGLPAPVALVTKEVTASRARALSTVLAVALAVMTAVAALGMEATFRSADRAAATRTVEGPGLQPESGLVPPGRAAADQEQAGLRALVYGLQGMLALVAVAGIVAVGLVTLRERRRELAVLGAIGFSVRQLEASTVAGQAVLAGVGAVAGIPLGIAFFRLAYGLANGSATGLVDAPPAQLALAVVVAVGIAALVALLPASSLRRGPLASALAHS